MPSALRNIVASGILLTMLSSCLVCAGNDFDSAIRELQQAQSGTRSQESYRSAWATLTSYKADKLPLLLAAMKETGPVAENWLRSAVDRIAERDLRETGNLPVEKLRKFVLDHQQAPRARRTAYEWLVMADVAAREELLPQMLNDTSLELRYDAVARLIDSAAEAEDDGAKLEVFQRALASARARNQMVECIEQLEKLGEAPDLEKYFAYVTHWTIIGPFDNDGGVGIENAYPPETELDYAKQYDGKTGEVAWKGYRTIGEDLDEVGRVDLNSVVNEEKGVAAYASATIILENEQEVECRYETVNATEFWVNGKQLASHNIYHMGGEFDQYVVPVTLKKGVNKILIKVCQNEQTESWARPWNFRLRITDPLGAAVDFAYESAE